jgi:hypothetical protein
MLQFVQSDRMPIVEVCRMVELQLMYSIYVAPQPIPSPSIHYIYLNFAAMCRTGASSSW